MWPGLKLMKCRKIKNLNSAFRHEVRAVNQSWFAAPLLCAADPDDRSFGAVADQFEIEIGV